MDLGLRGKSALITGGSRGLGRAMALALAAEGCDVAIAARTASTLESTAAELDELGVRSLSLECDVTDRAQVEAAVSAAAEGFGRLDIVIANAGGQLRPGLLDSDDEDWQFTLDINLLHAVRLIRAAVPHLRRQGEAAALITASITGARVQVPAQYGAAKAAQIYLATALARELAQYDIRVNAISPGSIEFEGGSWGRRREQAPEVMAEFAESQFPFKRLGRPEEIGEVAAFLCSPRASWITGQSIVVDGGQMNAGLWSPAALTGPQGQSA
ncbi:MAG: SDR family NAD(P)-dependent oxidoreductase [Chloroflexota bacterium]|nr:SDR family NAD(P)-dependent oxidoreductase [Chloroflexota bacterium]